MAFGIDRQELNHWKLQVRAGKIAIITHYWHDDRFPEYNTVTKVGCSNILQLKRWGKAYNLRPEWIDLHKQYPHYDLFGELQLKVLLKEKQFEQIKRFNLK